MSAFAMHCVKGLHEHLQHRWVSFNCDVGDRRNDVDGMCIILHWLYVQDFRDERELCEVCGKIEKRCKAPDKAKSPLLECDKCLRAFHADCCQPPVKTIPDVSKPFSC